MSRKVLILFGGGALLMLAVLAFFYFKNRVPFEQERPAVGQKAPDINFSDTAGNMFNLSDHKGKVMLINFWASWCPPCKNEMQWFERLYEKYEGVGFIVVAVSIDTVTPKLVKELGIYFPVISGNERIIDAYGNIADVPASFLVGRDGTIIKKVRKVYPEEQLEADIKAAL